MRNYVVGIILRLVPWALFGSKNGVDALIFGPIPYGWVALRPTVLYVHTSDTAN